VFGAVAYPIASTAPLRAMILMNDVSRRPSVPAKPIK
jgi:hypothetical protein